jgi:hypothetical protein
MARVAGPGHIYYFADSSPLIFSIDLRSLFSYTAVSKRQARKIMFLPFFPEPIRAIHNPLLSKITFAPSEI